MNQSNSIPVRALGGASRQSRRMLIAAVFAFTVPAAWFHGQVMLRWGDPFDLPRHQAALQRIPTALGDWRLVADGKPVSALVEKQLELRGYTHRIYEQPTTRQRITLLLMLGPAGPLVRHPPEICYESREHKLLASNALTIDAQGRRYRLRLLSYRPESLVESEFLVAYGFGADGRWDVPDSPRATYGGKPLLYKLQVLTAAGTDESETNSARLVDFLQQLLPTLNRYE
jgi:hypothetical protein